MLTCGTYIPQAHATYSARHKAVGAEGMTAAERRGHAGTCVLLARVTMARGDPAAAEDFARQVMALHRAPRGGWAGAAADVSSAHGKGPASPKGAPPSPPAPEPPPSNTPDAAPEPAAPDTRPVVPPLPLGPNSASQLNLQLPVGTVMPLGAVTPGGPLPVSRALISALRVMGLLKVQAAKGRRVEHWEHHVGTNGVAGRDALQRAEQYLREAADLASKWVHGILIQTSLLSMVNPRMWPVGAPNDEPTEWVRCMPSVLACSISLSGAQAASIAWCSAAARAVAHPSAGTYMLLQIRILPPAHYPTSQIP